VQATYPASLIRFRDSDYILAEIMVAVFLCKGSNLQVRSGIGCGNKNPKMKRLQDGVGYRVNAG